MAGRKGRGNGRGKKAQPQPTAMDSLTPIDSPPPSTDSPPLTDSPTPPTDNPTPSTPPMVSWLRSFHFSRLVKAIVILSVAIVLYLLLRKTQKTHPDPYERRASWGQDGTLSVTTKSGDKVLWEVSTGQPLRTEYEKQEEDVVKAYVVDGKVLIVGDCWSELQISMTLEKFVDRSPLLTKCGVISASRRVTIFWVGAESGQIFQRFPAHSVSTPSHLPIGEVIQTNEEVIGTEIVPWFPAVEFKKEGTYHIERCDYEFLYESGKTWLGFSKIKVMYECHYLDRLRSDCKASLPVEMHPGLLALGGVADEHLRDYMWVALFVLIVIAVSIIVNFARRFFHPWTPVPASRSTSTPTTISALTVPESPESPGTVVSASTSTTLDFSIDVNDIISMGRSGSIVYGGVFEGCQVAVKKIPKTHYDRALRESKYLKNFNKARDIVHFYGRREDEHFVYLLTDRCICNLFEFIRFCKDGNGEKCLLESLCEMNELKLWEDKKRNYPTPLLLSIMRNLISGLKYLHSSGVSHRDLKPQSILIQKEEGTIKAKICGMDMCRDSVESTSNASCGSRTHGWRAPEELKGKKLLTAASDLFSLGCILFFCISGGKHPFGENEENRDYNIKK